MELQELNYNEMKEINGGDSLVSTVYKYTEPLQIRLAPYIIQVDGFANKAVDVVESIYPYPLPSQQ